MSGNVTVEEFTYLNGFSSGFTTVTISGGQTVLLHTVSLNTLISSTLNVLDSVSGAPASAKTVASFAPQGSVSPVTLTYDVKLMSGLVVYSSGIGFNATVSYAAPAF
jgi:hypothetical protein